MKSLRFTRLVFLVPLSLAACGAKEAPPPAPTPPARAEQAAPPSAPATAGTPAPNSAGVPKAAAPASPERATPTAAPARLESSPAKAAATPPTAVPPAAPVGAPIVATPPVQPPGQPAAQALPAQAPSAAQAVSQEKPAPPKSPTRAAPDYPIILKASLGGIQFEHKNHSVARAIACTTCHHESRPEKPATLPQAACRTCHSPVATPPMKTKLQAAFHDATAKKGTCIDCHTVASGKGQAAPVKCLDCHKKELK